MCTYIYIYTHTHTQTYTAIHTHTHMYEGPSLFQPPAFKPFLAYLLKATANRCSTRAMQASMGVTETEKTYFRTGLTVVTHESAIISKSTPNTARPFRTLQLAPNWPGSLEDQKQSHSEAS